MSTEISYTSFDYYITKLIHNSYRDISVSSQRNQLELSFVELKMEINNNLMLLKDLDKVYYLRNLVSKLLYYETRHLSEGSESAKFYLEESRTDFNTLFTYNTERENILHDIVRTHPEDFYKIATKEMPIGHIMDIQRNFYFYICDLSTREVESFINERIREIESYISPDEKKIAIMPPHKSSYKIKSSLTVSQLAFLFKALVEEKLISIPHGEAESFYELIAETFSSKKSGNISPASFKNKYLTPDPNDAEFWVEKFTHFMQFAKDKRTIL